MTSARAVSPLLGMSSGSAPRLRALQQHLGSREVGPVPLPWAWAQTWKPGTLSWENGAHKAMVGGGEGPVGTDGGQVSRTALQCVPTTACDPHPRDILGSPSPGCLL